MKPAILLLALTITASPCVAQTNTAQTGTAQASPTPSTPSPQALRAALDYFFRASHDIHRSSLTPEQKAHSAAVLAKINELEHAGAKALRDGDYTAAEAAFRESLDTCPSPSTYYELAEALTGQGRGAEAIAAYRGGIYGPPFTTPIQNDIPLHGQFNPDIRVCPGGGAEVAWMKYALLLSQTGQGAEAAVIYRKAVIRVPESDRPGMSLALPPGTPAADLQAAAHVALGLCATFSGSQYDKAMGEFDAARRLCPDSPLTNYYYGYGWQNLGAKARLKVADAQQVKAAFQQAAAYGTDPVKKAAGEALARFR